MMNIKILLIKKINVISKNIKMKLNKNDDKYGSSE